MCQNCKALADAIDRYIAKADNSLEALIQSEGYYDSEVTMEYINAIEEGVAEALTAETQSFVIEAEKAVNLRAFAGKHWDKFKENDGLAVSLYRIFKKQLQSFMPHFVEGYIKLVDGELRLQSVSKRTIAWVESWSKELSNIMQLTSHNEIEGILKKGLENNYDIPRFIREIQQSGIREEYYRARRVAVTEVLRAHSVAHQEAIMQSPSVDTKTWRHSGPKKIVPRDNHVEIDGQTVPKGSPFTLWGADGIVYYPMYPRDTILPPGESVSCHCISQANASEEALGLSLEERKRLQQEAIEEMDAEWERELNERNKAKAGIEEIL